MNSVILYATQTPSAGHEFIRMGTVRLWVRAEVVAVGVVEALALARPRPEEIVLNSVPLWPDVCDGECDAEDKAEGAE